MSPAGVVYCARARRVAWSSRHSLTDQVPAPPAPRSLQLVQRASGVDYAVPNDKIKKFSLDALVSAAPENALVTATQASGRQRRAQQPIFNTTSF